MSTYSPGHVVCSPKEAIYRPRDLAPPLLKECFLHRASLKTE